MKPKADSLKNTNNIKKSVVKTNKKRERMQITNIRSKGRAMATDSTAIKRKINKYYKQLYVHKFDKNGPIP
jgi:hypothetical protein